MSRSIQAVKVDRNDSHFDAASGICAAASDDTTNDRAIDPDTARRRSRAIALLDAQPKRHIAVIAEAGDPAHVTVAIRGVAVGELTIPADRFDALALMNLVDSYGHG